MRTIVHLRELERKEQLHFPLSERFYWQVGFRFVSSQNVKNFKERSSRIGNLAEQCGSVGPVEKDARYPGVTLDRCQVAFGFKTPMKDSALSLVYATLDSLYDYVSFRKFYIHPDLYEFDPLLSGQKYPKAPFRDMTNG